FAFIVVLTLALGIGACSAIFTVVNGVLLRPLPYHDPDQLVLLVEHIPAAENRSGVPSRITTIDPLKMVTVRPLTQTLSDVSIYYSATRTLSGGGETARLEGYAVSPSTFPMIGTRPMLGRVFEAREETPGADGVVVLSDGTWRRHFGSDPDVIGQLAVLDGQPRLVVGVMPPGFAFPSAHSQFWIPCPTPARDGRTPFRTPMLARLKAAVTPTAAAAEVNAILAPPGSRAVATRDSGARFSLVRVQDE